MTLEELKKYELDIPNIGKPKYFDLTSYLSVVEMMVRSDEVERALWMLDNMPSWYRANYPKEAKELKKTILKNIMTAADYAREELQIKEMGKDYASYPRLNFVLHHFDIHRNKKLFLYDVGPGNHWLVETLRKEHGLGVGYMYDGIAKDHPQNDQCGEFNMFCALEVIEHLWQPMEIVQYYHTAVSRIGRGFDVILLSTPCNTYLGGSESDWKESKLGHLRCYSPKEFLEFGTNNFPEFKWSICVQSSMVLIGLKKYE